MKKSTIIQLAVIVILVIAMGALLWYMIAKDETSITQTEETTEQTTNSKKERTEETTPNEEKSSEAPTGGTDGSVGQSSLSSVVHYKE